MAIVAPPTEGVNTPPINATTDDCMRAYAEGNSPRTRCSGVSHE